MIITCPLKGRSPMAEGVFRSMVKSHPNVGEIDSAGTGAYHELDPPDSRTMATLKKHGIKNYDHAARKVTTDDFRKFDYIFAMDRYNLRDLKRIKSGVFRSRLSGTPVKEPQVMLFGDFGGKTDEEVIDPYYGADDGFEEVYQQALRFSNGFIEQVLDKGSSKAS